MNVEKEKSFKKIGSRLAIITGIAILLFASGIVPIPMVQEDEGTWRIVWQGSLAEAAEADPGAGASGFLGIYFVNHTDAPTGAYNHNASTDFETWADANLLPTGAATHAYANADEFNLELKHSVAFDIVVRVRFNKTHCWDGSQFVDADTRVNLTCSSFATMSAIGGTSIASYNDTGADFLYTNTYWQDADGGSGTGFTLGKGSAWASNPIQIIIWARY